MNNNKSDLEHTSKIEDHFTGFFADMAAARWMYSLKGIKKPSIPSCSGYRGFEENNLIQSEPYSFPISSEVKPVACKMKGMSQPIFSYLQQSLFVF